MTGATMTLPSQSAGHTPGPWISMRHVEKLWEIVADQGRGSIATVARWKAGVAGSALETEANATLIARAPDLLAENSKLKGQLEEAVGALESCDKAIRAVIGDGPVRGNSTPYTRWADMITAAVDGRRVLSKLKEAGS